VKVTCRIFVIRGSAVRIRYPAPYFSMVYPEIGAFHTLDM
jgi:hypothetical protein